MSQLQLEVTGAEKYNENWWDKKESWNILVPAIAFNP